MTTDRRTFLKRALSLPVAGGFAAVAAPGVKHATVFDHSCEGQWQDLPVGWARYTDFGVGCAPLKEDGSQYPEEQWTIDYDYSDPRDHLTSKGLSSLQVVHALAGCICVPSGEEGGEQVRYLRHANDLWWGLWELDENPFGMPSEVFLFDPACGPRCASTGECECLIGTYHPPWEYVGTSLMMDPIPEWGASTERRE